MHGKAALGARFRGFSEASGSTHTVLEVLEAKVQRLVRPGHLSYSILIRSPTSSDNELIHKASTQLFVPDGRLEARGWAQTQCEVEFIPKNMLTIEQGSNGDVPVCFGALLLMAMKNPIDTQIRQWALPPQTSHVPSITSKNQRLLSPLQ